MVEKGLNDLATETQRHRANRKKGLEADATQLPEKDPLTQRIIGCAIEVHRHLGPGLHAFRSIRHQETGSMTSFLCASVSLWQES